MSAALGPGYSSYSTRHDGRVGACYHALHYLLCWRGVCSAANLLCLQHAVHHVYRGWWACKQRNLLPLPHDDAFSAAPLCPLDCLSQQWVPQASLAAAGAAGPSPSSGDICALHNRTRCLHRLTGLLLQPLLPPLLQLGNGGGSSRAVCTGPWHGSRQGGPADHPKRRA
jgi:hypothetical protein